jgi:hypothetical protein
MMYDGRNYRRNRFLGWRYAREGDVYMDGAVTRHEGELITSPYVVVFKVKDAPIGTKDISGYPTEVYFPDQVTSDKLISVCAHTATNVVLGQPKTGIGRPLKDLRYNVGQMAGHIIHTGQRYVEQAHYLVRDGAVHQWTSRRMAEQEDGL